MHEIVFACEAFEAVTAMEVVELSLCLFRSGTIAITLLFQSVNLAVAMQETDHALIADEEIDHGKSAEYDEVLHPFAELDLLPQLQEILFIELHPCKKFVQNYFFFCTYANFFVLL